MWSRSPISVSVMSRPFGLPALAKGVHTCPGHTESTAAPCQGLSTVPPGVPSSGWCAALGGLTAAHDRPPCSPLRCWGQRNMTGLMDSSGGSVGELQNHTADIYSPDPPLLIGWLKMTCASVSPLIKWRGGTVHLWGMLLRIKKCTWSY